HFKPSFWLASRILRLHQRGFTLQPLDSLLPFLFHFLKISWDADVRKHCLLYGGGIHTFLSQNNSFCQNVNDPSRNTWHADSFSICLGHLICQICVFYQAVWFIF
ncbi:UNVERIFIED_CONTAM: hypothetical protein K2H54_041968, partial [Gekko kuhli]